ncbi:Hint domain-containing protein [Vannielia litorea]|uniref:Hint domain-containing protein n=1 Tax=Vannielia litorea TaxID=1217970 RepID=UPI001BCDD862|nr:Hint domain-containing protein [Vannielia litorea]MBS8225044.1 hypothetical protein [Vannielia litorea]
MSLYSIGGYNGADFIVVGGGAPGVGSHVRLDSDWSASTHAYTFDITDTADASFDQSSAGQTGVVSDASGTPLQSGSANLSGWGAVLDDGNGGTVSIYEVHIDGILVGYVADGEVQPGVDYQITTVLSAGTPGIAYADLTTSTYEQADINTVEGGNYDDVLEGGDGDDTLTGHGGDDIISGGAGSDLIYGLVGDDTISGGIGDDWLHAGDGSDVVLIAEGDGHDIVSLGESTGDHDVLSFSGTGGVTVTFDGWEQGTYTLTGASGQFWEVEEIGGTEGADIIDASAQAADITLGGQGGDDTLAGGSGSDTLSGGEGDDLLIGNAGADAISGGDGADTIWGGTGDDILDGGTGNDTFLIPEGDGNDTITGGDRTDEVCFFGSGVTVTYTSDGAGGWVQTGSTGSFTGIEEITGSAGSDTLDASATSTGVSLSGGGANDTVIGGAGDDVLDGGDGSDTLTGGDGADTLTGGGGDDEIYGGAGDDVIDAGTGHDEIYGGAGSDTVTTGDGYDILFLQPGDGSVTITDFDMTLESGQTVDQFDISAMGPVSGFDIAVSDDGAGNAVLTFPGGESVTLLGVDPATMDASTMFSMGIPCFTTGTSIDTPDGPVPVEALRAGDAVLTSRGVERLLWSGTRACGPALLSSRPELKPVVVAGQKVSRQHCFLARFGGEEWLVRARHMALEGVPGVRIAEGCRRVRYHHLLLPRHGLLRAGGFWQASFYPGPWALRSLDPEALIALIAALPGLGAVLGGASPEVVYGPTVRPLLPRRALRGLSRSALRQLLVPARDPLTV